MTDTFMQQIEALSEQDVHQLIQRRFITLLSAIEDFETDYPYRNLLIFSCLPCAAHLGMPYGFRIDAKEPEWPVAFIQLPNGQISWHVPQFDIAWDGHTTEEKYARIRAYVDAIKKEVAE